MGTCIIPWSTRSFFSAATFVFAQGACSQGGLEKKPRGGTHGGDRKGADLRLLDGSRILDLVSAKEPKELLICLPTLKHVEALLSHRFVIFVITQELLKEQLPSAEARVSTQMRSMTLHHGVSPISNTNHTGSFPTDMQLVGMHHLLGCHVANRSSSSCPPMKGLQRCSDSSVQEVTNSEVAP